MWGFQVSPDSSRVVYMADQDTGEVMELYVSCDLPDRIRLPVVLKN